MVKRIGYNWLKYNKLKEYFKIKKMPAVGIGPTTYGFSVHRSTNWAMLACVVIYTNDEFVSIIKSPGNKKNYVFI